MMLNNYNVKSSKITEPLRILVISDSHNHFEESWICSVKPDIICIIGDFVLGRNLNHRSEKEPWTIYNSTAEKMLHILSQLAPVFLTLGNHEYMFSDYDIQLIRDIGITVLDDSYIRYNDQIVIGGLTSGLPKTFRHFRNAYMQKYGYSSPDWHYDYYHQGFSDDVLNTPEAGWIDDFEKESGFKILLSHHPEYWALKSLILMKREIDLVLSGHARGGQVRLFGQGLYAPGQGFFPVYTKGQYWGKYGQLIVSAGMSNTYTIPRVFNPPEILQISVRPLS